MLKLLLFDVDLLRLNKIRTILSAMSILSEIKIANDEARCVNLIKDEYFDIFILNINSEEFFKKLLVIHPSIEDLPVLLFGVDVDISNFKNCKKINLETVNFKLVNFLSSFSEIIPEDILKTSQQLISEYILIKFSILRKINNTPCDLYIRLGSDKFVKIVNKDEKIHGFLLDKYESKNVEEFYTRKIDFYAHSDSFFSSSLPNVSNTESSGEYYSQSTQIINDIFNEVGISKGVIDLADELIKNSLVESKDPELENLLNKFKFSKDRYIFDHSYLTSVLAVAICEKFEWRNRQNMQKIVFASIFHDFAFVDPKLAYFESGFLNNGELNKEQKDEIFNHPKKIAEMLQKNKNISSEVISILMKHHEAHGENSYPNGISSTGLSILECIFIISHEFANELYRIAFRHDKLLNAIENTLDFANTGNMKQVRKVLIEIFSEKFQLKIETK